MVERCALTGSDLKIKFRTILLTSISVEPNDLASSLQGSTLFFLIITQC